jgi:hypothetical protein
VKYQELLEHKSAVLQWLGQPEAAHFNKWVAQRFSQVLRLLRAASEPHAMNRLQGMLDAFEEVSNIQESLRQCERDLAAGKIKTVAYAKEVK